MPCAAKLAWSELGMRGKCVASGRQARARRGFLHPGVEAFEAGCESGQSRCAGDRIEIDVEGHPPARGRLHAFEPEARPDETPFFGAEQANAQATRITRDARRQRACKAERYGDPGSVVDRAL